jgi:actin-related protein
MNFRYNIDRIKYIVVNKILFASIMMCKIIVREDIYANIILSRRTTIFSDISKVLRKRSMS